MTMTVEDGSVVPNANSYSTLADADTYLADRGLDTDWTTKTDPEKEAALILGTDYLQQMYGSRWRGSLVDEAQSLDFPRMGITKEVAGEEIELPSDEVPINVVRSTILLAHKSLSSTLLPDIAANASGSVTKQKVGSLEVEYDESVSKSSIPSYQDVEGLLRELISGGGNTRSVYRS